jgi:hypothetical protein
MKKKRKWLARAKDLALEKALVVFLRPKIERYGEVRAFTLDTAEKSLSAEIMLRGESAPLVISDARYRIEQHGDETMLVFHGVKASKEWVQNLLDDQFQEIRVKVPEVVKALLE